MSWQVRWVAFRLYEVFLQYRLYAQGQIFSVLRRHICLQFVTANRLYRYPAARRSTSWATGRAVFRQRCSAARKQGLKVHANRD
jgi:hypothetical protein